MKRSLKSMSFLKFSVLLLAMATTFAACNDDDDVKPVEQNSKIAAQNLMTDQTELDMHLGEEKVNKTSILAGDFMPYLDVKAGEHNVTFFEVANTDTLSSLKQDFKVGQAYTLVVLGDKTNGEVIALSDDLKKPADGKTKLRLVNLVENSGNLSLWVAEAEAALVEEVAYRTTKEFVELSANESVRLEVKSSAVELVSAIDELALNAGKIYTVYIFEEEIDGVSTPVIKVVENK